MDEDAVERALDDADDRNKRAKVEGIPTTANPADGTATEVLVPRIYKILTTKQLREGNRWAVRLEQNRTLTDEFVASLDPTGTHVVGFTMPHTNYAGTEGMRCQVFCKVTGSSEPVEAWIDLRHADYAELERVTLAEKA